MEPTADIRIRRIGPNDGMRLRDLRLRSLADAPEAFGQPLAEAQGRPDAEWHRSARQSSHGDSRTWLFAVTDDRTFGLVQGRKRRPATLLLFSMWVDATARRQGVGRALIDTLEAWARGWNASETILWVHASNTGAMRFYEDLGFSVLDDGQDAEAGARFGARAMHRHIVAPT